MAKSKSAESIAIGNIGVHSTKCFTERAFNLLTDAEHLVELSEKWKNVPKDIAQGHMFEQLEISKFNLSALKENSDLYAKTTASMGLPTDPVDIVIKKGDKILREVQAKSCNNAARSAFALSHEKYEEMVRLAPKDQHNRIKELLEERIKKGTLKKEDYEQTYRNLKESLSFGDVKSSGTTYQEAIDTTDIDVAKEKAAEIKKDAALSDMHGSAKQSGLIGAGISGTITAGSDIYKLYKGEVELADVISNTAISAAKGYVTGYAVTFLSKGITHTTTHYLGKSVGSALAKSNLPTAIAAGVVTSSKSVVAYMKGDIELEELQSQVSHTAVTCSASFYYGALGQTICPIPIVGALVGAGVGYFVGNLLHQSSLIALGDSEVVKASKERRRQVEAFALSVIPKIQQHRAELESTIEKHFQERREEFINCFDILDSSLNGCEPDQYISGLERINNQFGKTLQFKSFEEFDEFMLDEDAKLKF